MSPKSVVILKSIGAVTVTVLGSLAATNAFPSLTAIFSAVAGVIGGWLGLPTPQAKEVSK